MLGRRRRKETQPETTADDRDKTLEPEKPTSGFSNPLARSATTILSSTSSAKKERTPYRLHRNYSDRKPTTSGVAASAYASSKSRPELSLLHSSTSAAIPKSSYYETPASESLYDPYGGAYGYSSAYTSRLPTSTASRYNDYDHYGLSNGPGTYGYYEGRDRDKENTFKSKYEPSRLYAELNNNAAESTFSRGDDRDRSKRYQKAYRRTATAHDSRPMVSSYRDYEDETPSTSRYAPRKSLGGYQRSQTQKFFDSEKTSVLRSLHNDANNNNVDGYGADDEIKTEAMKEREARRKEIQGLIAKYAQIDDVYNRAIDNEPTNNNNHDAAITSTVHTGRSRLFESKATDIDNNMNGALGLGLSAYGTHQPHSSFLPLSKTQSVATMSSVNRSRIPKTFSTFVR